jgi:hypothetical protein
VQAVSGYLQGQQKKLGATYQLYNRLGRTELGLNAGDDRVELTEEHLGMLFFNAYALGDDSATGRDAQVERGDWLSVRNGLVNVPLLNFVDALQTGAGLFT